ncbi:MAG: hypothetical protein KKD44_06465 [Proteobacteria bacterium]|nr:hypothetical protein [Pseudomonadota bacterium]
MISWYSQKAYIQDLTAVSLDEYKTALNVNEEDFLPSSLKDWLSRLRLFYGLPFEYLVPDERLLPVESIRFFYVDRNWSDRMVDGALSVGKTTSREYAHHHAVFDAVVTTLDNEERRIRGRLKKNPQITVTGRAADMTGFLLRSQAVANYPGIEVLAYQGEENMNNRTPLRLLRMDRPGPDVLLCLFDGVPDIVDIEEPREGIQFGVEMNLDGNKNIEGTVDCPSGLSMRIRHMHGTHTGYEVGWINRDTSDDSIDGSKKTYTVPVPVRKGNPQVIHVEKLQQAIEDVMTEISNEPDVEFIPPGQFGPAELAVQMLQFPFHQRFIGDGQPRPLDIMPEFTLMTQYSGATVGITTAISVLSQEELEDLNINPVHDHGHGGGDK